LHNRQTGAVKYLLILCGVILVAVGVIGIVVPGLPTTIFLIAAAACFAKSSPWLHNWLISHRWFGPIIINWQNTRSIPKNAKRVALTMMALACVYTSLMLDSIYLIILIYLLMFGPAVFVFRLPLTEDVQETQDTVDAVQKTTTD